MQLQGENPIDFISARVYHQTQCAKTQKYLFLIQEISAAKIYATKI